MLLAFDENNKCHLSLILDNILNLILIFNQIYLLETNVSFLVLWFADLVKSLKDNKKGKAAAIGYADKIIRAHNDLVEKGLAMCLITLKKNT
jgi:hypothetical protein